MDPTRRDLLKGATAGSGIVLAGCLGNESEAYPDSNIDWLGFDGTFFAYSQAFSEYLPKHLPEEVNVVVDQPSDWVTGQNELYRSDSDGHTIGFANVPGNVVSQVLEDVEYDLQEYTWLAHVETTAYSLGVAADSEYSSIEDLQAADTVQFSAPGGSTAELACIIAAEVMDIDAEVVHFGGSAESIAAVLRGDVDATSFTHLTTPMRTAVQDDDIELLITYEEEPPAIAPDVTTSEEAGYDELTNFGLSRVIGAPPGVDDEVQEILTDSLIDTMESSEFQQWADDEDLPIQPADQGATSDLIDDAFSLVENYQSTIEEYQ